MPENEHGKKINHIQNHDEYIQYINWLAEYLYETPITFSDRQKGIVEICNKYEPLHAAIWFSDCCGYYIWERDHLEDQARKNLDYDQIVEEEYESIKFDLKLEKNIPNCPGDLDVPYRGVLRTLILRCRSKEERRNVIKMFYDNFNETASK